jgi:hypothetical protein
MFGSLHLSPKNSFKFFFLYQLRFLKARREAGFDHIRYAGTQPFNKPRKIKRFCQQGVGRK